MAIEILAEIITANYCFRKQVDGKRLNLNEKGAVICLWLTVL